MSFDDLLKSLHQDYLKSIPDKILLIAEQVKAQDTSNVRESFHKLKGTGKTYGFPEVSELAAMVESICIVQPNVGLDAASKALDVLSDIYHTRQNRSDYSLLSDTRVADIRKLLPS